MENAFNNKTLSTHDDQDVQQVIFHKLTTSVQVEIQAKVNMKNRGTNMKNKKNFIAHTKTTKGTTRKKIRQTKRIT